MTYRRRNKKRIRSVKTIEAEIEAHEERYRKHLLWSARNEKYSERWKYYCSRINEQIFELKRTERNYKRTLGLFRSKELTEEASEKLRKLERQLTEGEKKALIDVPELDFPYEQYPNGRCMHSDWKMIPVYLDRELDQAKAKEAKKEKQRTIRARVAQADNKTRELATSVKLRLPKDHLCPYCGNDLGDDTHADHIYPVSRGGLSTLVNMVYVCATCNIRKRDNTLKMFIDEFGLDRDGIEKRLSKLGKEY
jgi:5-methylcytosine-specific restriction endonuclease McrA